MNLRVQIVGLVLLALTLFSGSAFAQGPTFNVKGGIGFATVSAEPEEGEPDFLTDSRTGLVIGAGVDVPVNNVFAVGIEALYAQKGGTGAGSFEGSSFEAEAKVDYIEIPILAKIGFATMTSIRPFVYGGVAPAFRTGSGSFKLKVDGEVFDEDNDLSNDLKSADVGLVLGGGVKFGQIGIEARYNLGLVNISKNSDDGENIKTRQFAILASFSF